MSIYFCVIPPGSNGVSMVVNYVRVTARFQISITKNKCVYPYVYVYLYRVGFREAVACNSGFTNVGEFSCWVGEEQANRKLCPIRNFGELYKILSIKIAPRKGIYSKQIKKNLYNRKQEPKWK